MLLSYGGFFLRLIIPPAAAGGVNKDCFSAGCIFLCLIISGLTARDNLAPSELE